MNAFSDEDELSSSVEVVDKEFDKMEFLNKLHTSFFQLITRLLEKSMKTCRNKQHRKLVCQDKAMPPPKTALKTACKAVHECMPTHNM